MAKTYDDIRMGANTFASSTVILETVGKAALEQSSQETGLKVLAQAMIPAIALKAFSCELALKALIAKSGKVVDREHRLNELYKKIDDSDKSAISQAVIQNMKDRDENYSDAEFQRDLSEAAMVFVDWRYFYEKSLSVNLLFIDVLFKELIQYIEQ